PINVQESAFEIALSSMGSFKPLFLCLITILTFANSFGRDIEQDVLMGELTLPVRKKTLFTVKLITNFLMILLIDFVSTLFFTWIITASIPFIPIMSMVLIDAISLLLIVSITILMSIVLKSRFGAVIVAIAIYFLENILLPNISLMISTVNPPNIDPTYILLKLVLLGEITVYTWGIILTHLLFPFALLSFAFFFMKMVLQLD
ncbi:MAG: ABC transporter permease subunit, partial [Candidatus Brockarchaeota archaeon]|nr:ABC transporter permease subunit [Candidatus Brockarchaeota archaeon]